MEQARIEESTPAVYSSYGTPLCLCSETMRVEDGRTPQTGAKDVFLGAFPSGGRCVHIYRRSVFSIVSPCHGRSDQIVTAFPAAVASWPPAGDQHSP